MKYIYKNITATVEQTLIPRSSGGITTIHKCQIANVDSSAAVVDVYIESIDEAKTIKVHGFLTDGSLNNNYNSATGDYANKEGTKTYYEIKGVTIPVGTTLSLFTDHPCSHSNQYALKIVATYNVDVLVEYDNVITSTTRRNTNRTTSQY